MWQLAQRLSLALAVVAGLAAGASFVFWPLFHRDAPMTVGNMRGTAVAVLLVLPLLVASMRLASGSLRAQIIWLGCVAYLAYNAVLFCFAAQFNALFLVFTSWLALAFWATLALLRAVDPGRIRAGADAVPVRTIAAYLLVSAVLFAALWLQAIIPAALANAMPDVLVQAGFTQNPIWVLDFAFTFPLMVIGSVWLWRRRPWGYVIAGMMTIMLTIETAGIAVDQVFGHLHDPAAPLDAVPVMLVCTAGGLLFSRLFLKGLRDPGRV